MSFQNFLFVCLFVHSAFVIKHFKKKEKVCLIEDGSGENAVYLEQDMMLCSCGLCNTHWLNNCVSVGVVTLGRLSLRQQDFLLFSVLLSETFSSSSGRLWSGSPLLFLISHNRDLRDTRLLHTELCTNTAHRHYSNFITAQLLKNCQTCLLSETRTDTVKVLWYLWCSRLTRKVN